MKIGLHYKLRSGALQFTVFIAVLVALLLAGVTLLAYTHRFYIEQSKAILDNIQLADSGIAYLKNQQVVSVDTVYLSIPDYRQGQEIKVNLSAWGIFEKAYVKSTHRKKTFIKTALMGTSLLPEERTAIYLQETFNPLAVVGHTKITGNAMLPSQGIRPGNISGNSYYGSELLYGEVTKSDTLLPKLKYDYKKLLRYYLYEYQPEGTDAFIPMGTQRQITNSFEQPTKGYFVTSPLVLENLSITGNIIIRSSESITIKSTAILKDVILSAPVIIIDDGVKGNFQAIANTTIKVGAGCQLSYPSALVLVERDNRAFPAKDEFDNTILIGSNSVVRGSLCYFDTTDQSRDYKANIKTEKDGLVKGEIYCEGNLELKASAVTGSVYTKNFVSNEGGTTFVNHLYNSTINSEELPEFFGGIVFDNHSKSVMKWLY